MKADTCTRWLARRIAHTRARKHGRTDTREIKGFEYVGIDYFKLLARLSLDRQCF